jgi:hypothetical protein
MARPLVHRMVHTQDRPGFQGGSEWACPFCPHQVVYWPLCHKVMVKGQAEVLHRSVGRLTKSRSRRSMGLPRPPAAPSP